MQVEHIELVIIHSKSSYLRSSSHIFFFKTLALLPDFLHIPWPANFFGAYQTFHNFRGVLFFFFFFGTGNPLQVALNTDIIFLSNKHWVVKVSSF
jgi:hypothetical protein